MKSAHEPDPKWRFTRPSEMIHGFCRSDGRPKMGDDSHFFRIEPALVRGIGYRKVRFFKKQLRRLRTKYYKLA